MDGTLDPERRELTVGSIQQLDRTDLGEDDVIDTVNHPPHYCNRNMEAIDIIEMIIEIEPNPKVAYNMSNVLKYLLRFRDKGKATHDLSKAVWYLNRMIDKINEEKER
jgi:hypothetical protein